MTNLTYENTDCAGIQDAMDDVLVILKKELKIAERRRARLRMLKLAMVFATVVAVSCGLSTLL